MMSSPIFFTSDSAALKGADPQLIRSIPSSERICKEGVCEPASTLSGPDIPFLSPAMVSVSPAPGIKMQSAPAVCTDLPAGRLFEAGSRDHLH